MEFKLILSEVEADIILEGLGELQAKKSLKIITKIHSEYQTQKKVHAQKEAEKVKKL